MPRETKAGRMSPEILELLELICAKWTIVILLELTKSQHRFGELKRAIPEISTKVLTQFLRALERDGFLTRTVAAQVPPRTDYALTPLGRDLMKHLLPVGGWAAKSYKKISTARERYDAR